MRAVVAFLLSFVLAVIIGSLILPDNTPKIKPKPLAGAAPIAPSLDFLPGLPSLIVPRLDDASKRYEEAWRLLKAGRYRAAESAYLQILIRNPQDQKAVQGLVMLQRLLANQDPKRLQEQAEGYRRTIALGQLTEEQYSPRELELLAEASLSAANEIVSEQNTKVSSLSKVTITTDVGPTVPAHASVLRDPMGAIKQRITQLATSLGLTPAKTDVAAVEKPKPSTDKENVIVILVSDSHQPVLPSIAQTPAPSSPPGDAHPASGSIASPVTQQTQGATTQSAPAVTTKDETPAVSVGPVNNPSQTPTKTGGSGAPSPNPQRSVDKESGTTTTGGSTTSGHTTTGGTTGSTTGGTTTGGTSTGGTTTGGTTTGGTTGGTTTGGTTGGTTTGGTTTGGTTTSGTTTGGTTTAGTTTSGTTTGHTTSGTTTSGTTTGGTTTAGTTTSGTTTGGTTTGGGSGGTSGSGSGGKDSGSGQK